MTGHLTASRARAISGPTAGDLRTRVGALTRTCPECGAAPGVMCLRMRGGHGKVKRPHLGRQGWTPKNTAPEHSRAAGADQPPRPGG